MSSAAAEALRARLVADTDADMASLQESTNRNLSIGQDVWRLRWRGQLTTAVAADADLHTTCGAVLDVLAALEQAIANDTPQGEPLLDVAGVNVLVDRAAPGDSPTEVDQALRSMRDAVQGVTARIWYRRGDTGWIGDDAPAPVWRDDDERVIAWVNDLLLPRLTTQPGAFAVELVDAVGDPSLQLYPAPITSKKPDVFALRIDGLQLGTVDCSVGTLTVGKPGKTGDGPQRKAFIDVFDQQKVSVRADPGKGDLSVTAAAERIRALLQRFRDVDVPGAPLTHRAKGGVRFVDEHTLEARLLKGLISLDDDSALIADDRIVARGSQFPTLWGHGAKPRYLDAMVRRDRTPVAVELKVAVGGQGRYYRRSLVQAVLYRHFIRSAPGLDVWFDVARLDRTATEAAIGIPIPTRWTPRFDRDLDLLKRVAARVGASVNVLDDRATPNYLLGAEQPEPQVDDLELMTWRLAAALSTRWPRSLGRALEAHSCGGFYDEIRLHHVQDATFAWPSPTPRLSMNRPGSLAVFSQTGSFRWTWRHIWNHLHAGGDLGDAAEIVGALAGLGQHEAPKGATFPELAVAFLETVNGSGWSWRCAWPDNGDVAPWVERFSRQLQRYNRIPVGDSLPTIARIWGALRDGQAAAIVDQDNLRIWTWTDGAVCEVVDGGPLERMEKALGKDHGK